MWLKAKSLTRTKYIRITVLGPRNMDNINR